MLQITIHAQELWDEATERFVYVKEQTITLEHSLVSISKWESKWHVPFFSKDDKTPEMLIDYIRCMNLTQHVDPVIFNYLSADNHKAIQNYIEDPRSATTFGEQGGPPNREIITSELIYFWMVTWRIPFECQRWHINRLLNLIRICGIKNQQPKKMSQREIMSRNAALNAARRKKWNTKG